MRSNQPVLLAVTMMVLLSLACTALTGLLPGGEQSGVAPGISPATAAAQVEVEPTATEVRRRDLPPTPTPFHVLAEDDVRAELDLSRPDRVDYFDDPAAWFNYDTAGRAAYRIEDGRLIGVDYEPEETFTWWTYADRQAGNTYVEVTATNGDCIAKDAVGLVIRVNPETAAGGYGLEVSCDGEWRFLKFKRGEAPDEIVSWTSSPQIKTGLEASNRLGLWGYQREFVLFINGAEVGRAADPPYSFPLGSFALYVRASQTYDLMASFDDFAFWHVAYKP
jgi:hypothetical protein